MEEELAIVPRHMICTWTKRYASQVLSSDTIARRQVFLIGNIKQPNLSFRLQLQLTCLIYSKLLHLINEFLRAKKGCIISRIGNIQMTAHDKF